MAAAADYFIFLLSLAASSVLISTSHSRTVVEDLATLKPPPDFDAMLRTNCLHNPSHRYCGFSPADIDAVFKSTIVASYLCNESRNPNCVESFPRIDLRNRPTIAPLYLSFNFFWKYCPISINSIDFSNNSITGSFPADILLCTQIKSLDFSHNRLTGDLLIKSFDPLTNLSSLNLSYNFFSEAKISDSQSFLRRFNSSSFIDSGLLPCPRTFTLKAVLLLVAFPVSVILIICCFGWLCFRRPDYLPRFLRPQHRFTPSMLRAATDGFSRKNLILKTEEFRIFRGRLRDGCEVRVEIRLNDIDLHHHHHHTNITSEFVEECKVLVQLRHKNLLRVMGWCASREMRAVVTEWTEGDDVEMWLSGSCPPWKQRLKILMGVVEGMCYLQENWPEVGYDLRTGSLLLRYNNLEPLITRFKVGEDNFNSKKVYKLGVLLLELITNRRPREEFERGEAGFVEFVRANYPENLGGIIDDRMMLPENMLDQAKSGVGLGLMCTDVSMSKRPSVHHIHDMIRRAYKACVALTSQNCETRRNRRDGGKGQR
ncbi:unnamed protein product [Linum tenue]|uniref:Serine-threonine/tyrosine-protein kinase catalytic domain-containing protein n=1 Tax=Linum tenue TaxID=586396 RepID=A0AAV0QLQ2_9ROSI|nr:unnamed protein product [Linum tenue]